MKRNSKMKERKKEQLEQDKREHKEKDGKKCIRDGEV
jgi:hypothetical protein